MLALCGGCVDVSGLRGISCGPSHIHVLCSAFQICFWGIDFGLQEETWKHKQTRCKHKQNMQIDGVNKELSHHTSTLTNSQPCWRVLIQRFQSQAFPFPNKLNNFRASICLWKLFNLLFSSCDEAGGQYFPSSCTDPAFKWPQLWEAKIAGEPQEMKCLINTLPRESRVLNDWRYVFED